MGTYRLLVDSRRLADWLDSRAEGQSLLSIRVKDAKSVSMLLTPDINSSTGNIALRKWKKKMEIAWLYKMNILKFNPMQT